MDARELVDAKEQDIWEVLALRYGRSTERKIDYFVWIIRNASETIVVDCGFDEPSAARRGRHAIGDVPGLLRKAGIEPDSVPTVILTHLHFDHVGCLGIFSSARFHLARANLAVATSEDMEYDFLRDPYDVVHVKEVIDLLHSGRLQLCPDDTELRPGISLHRVDGHATGLLSIRVKTKRGYVVLASDAVPLIEHVVNYVVPSAHIDATAMLKGYDRLRSLATSVDHIIPGHDPLVCDLYPAERGLDFVFQLHAPAARRSG